MSEKVFKYRNGFKPSLLPTESEAEFYELYSSLERDINPTNAIMAMQLNDMAWARWGTARTEKCRTAALTLGSAIAIVPLFTRLGIATTSDDAKTVAKEWLQDPEKRKTVTQTLGQLNLDDAVLQAAAMEAKPERFTALDKQLSFSLHCQDRALRNIIEFGKAFDAPNVQGNQEDETSAAEEPTANGKSEAA